MISLDKKQKTNIFILLATIVCLSVFIYWVQSDNTGKIIDPSQKQSDRSSNETKRFEGQYISFDYSAQYVIRYPDHPGDDLAKYELDADKPYTKKIAVTISNLPDGTLNTNSAYLLRKSHKDKFFKRESAPTQLNAEIWSSTDGTKQTVFIVQNGRVAVLAFTQDGGDKNMYNNEVDTIVRSLKWN